MQKSERKQFVGDGFFDACIKSNEKRLEYL